MANNNLEYIKEGLSTQEQILTQAIAGERFARKHKGKIIAIVVIGVLAIIYFSVTHLIEQNNIKANNALFSKLLANPTDTALQNELEKANINLFALFALGQAKENNSTALIDRALNNIKDENLRQILLASKGENVALMGDYETLISGFKELKNAKFDAAKLEFSKIPENSSLKEISKNLEHYQGIKQ